MKKETFEYECGVDKEYISMYVSKEFKEMWEESKDKQKLFDSYIVKHIEDVKKDLHASVESLDDEILEFKGTCIKYRREFAEVTEGIVDDTYKSMEKLQTSRHQFEQNIKSMNTELDRVEKRVDDVTKKIDGINSKVSGVSVYKLENVLELLNKIENLTEKQQRMFEFLIENNKEWV